MQIRQAGSSIAVDRVAKPQERISTCVLLRAVLRRLVLWLYPFPPTLPFVPHLLLDEVARASGALRIRFVLLGGTDALAQPAGALRTGVVVVSAAGHASSLPSRASPASAAARCGDASPSRSAARRRRRRPRQDA